MLREPCQKDSETRSSLFEATRIPRNDLGLHFLEQSSTIRVDGVGHDAVQIPLAWMLGGSVVPWFDRHVTEAMISSAPHSEVHPIEPHVVPSIDLT